MKRLKTRVDMWPGQTVENLVEIGSKFVDYFPYFIFKIISVLLFYKITKIIWPGFTWVNPPDTWPDILENERAT